MHLPRLLARFASLLALLFAATSVSAGETSVAFRSLLGRLMQKDVDVLSVTDMTEAGRAYPTPAPNRPIRYKLIYVGRVTFGREWAGETLPTKQNTIDWIMTALKEQGYLIADATHPPEQLFVFGWGMMEGGPGRPALGFLGGEKVNLMWEYQQMGGFVSPNVLRRGLLRMGVAGKVWDFAEGNLFMGVVRSFTIDSQNESKPVTKLWETRFACPATGLAFDETMPLLIKAAAPSFGRETAKPVSINASDLYNSGVNMHDIEILGEAQTPPAGKNLAPESEKPEGR